MPFFSLAFLLGVLLLQYFSKLPSLFGVMIIIIAIIFLKIVFKNKSHYLNLFIIFSLGFAWSLFYSQMELASKLPNKLEGKTFLARGYIASIPDISEHRTAFLFAMKNAQPKLVRLSWQNNNEKNKKLVVGDEWELFIRLKKIHSTLNPGGFDYEAKALEEGIRAQGYVVDKLENKRLSGHWYHYSLDRTRQFLKEKIEKNLPSSITSPWIVALAVGEVILDRKS